MFVINIIISTINIMYRDYFYQLFDCIYNLDIYYQIYNYIINL